MISLERVIARQPWEWRAGGIYSWLAFTESITLGIFFDHKFRSMFNPDYFKIDDREEMLAFLTANNFGLLISMHDGDPVASHLPFLPDADGNRLHCHLARANPQWQQLEDQRVLIALQGSHDYISPTWYETPGVPTWNYQALHIYGRCRVFDDAKELSQLVNTLAAHHETGSENPWQPEYGDKMLRGIVGVEITIDEMQCKYKLSQNRPVEDHAPVIEQLEKRGAEPLAAAMRKTLNINAGEQHE